MKLLDADAIHLISAPRFRPTRNASTIVQTPFTNNDVQTRQSLHSFQRFSRRIARSRSGVGSFRHSVDGGAAGWLALSWREKAANKSRHSAKIASRSISLGFTPPT